MPIRLLIVEDQPALRRVLELSFPAPEFSTRLSGHGDEGLRWALQDPPDVLIVDLMLPGSSGLDICRAVRAEPAGARTRIVMLTARKQVSDREAGLAAGADVFLGKPFSIPDLREQVRALARAGGETATS